VPSIALQLSTEDRAALREYLAFYRANASTIATRATFPFVDADACQALEDGEWDPYLREVRQHALKAAAAGLSYAEWFEIAARHRKAVLAVLSDQATPPTAAAALVRGMDRLIEAAVYAMGETYLALRLQHPPAEEAPVRVVVGGSASAPVKQEPDVVLTAAKTRVLVADDDPQLLRTLARVLRRSGHDVVEADSGRRAITELEQGTFDTILSDIHMPDGGGLDLLRVVRRVDLDVPVVLMSGVSDVKSAAAALAYGAFRYLSKPLDLGDLETTIRHSVRAHALARLRRRAASATGKHLGAADRAGLEVRFEQAFESLWIAFQPIYHASGGALFGVEALLRSNEPSLPSPVAVLEAASHLGRGTALGRRIRMLAANRVTGHADLQLFVNLQPDDLVDADLVADSASLSKIASRVILEVTERTALQPSSELSSRIAHLRELGFRLAVDDIGAGYSGLTSFTDLMPEIVKIDMALVRDIHLNVHKQRTVKALCNLCHEVSCLVIGEGVETAEERDCLTELGCDLLQGYLLGRPRADLPTISPPALRR
jgi:EAL domain-containing protein (putative c-di-GMP-specific phosphodiesterase class I)